MDFPCEKCLVRPVCSKKLIIERGPDKLLIMERAEKCPYIQEYFGKHTNGTINHDFEKIHTICELFGATDGNSFLWFEWEI